MEARPLEKRIYLTDKDRVVKYENNLVSVTVGDGRELTALEPRRLFPISRQYEYITLLNEDGEEVAIIRSLSDLDPDSRAVVRNSLEDYYLVPEITRIISVTEKNGKIHWVVITDRGEKEFDVKNRNHDIKVSKDGRVRVRDSDDNRYTITDYRALDRRSRAHLIADL
jgi:hypothetical protein